VGKTTTCAKLAARIRDTGHPVGLLSLDTIRLAGALHLNSYAEVLGLPSAIAYSPEEVEQSLEGLLSSMTTIIVDTPGIQWTDPEGVRRLQPLLEALPDAEVHALLAVSMRVRDQVRYMSTFKSLKPKAITFTKIDETDSYGCLFTTPLKAALPVAYLSDGQRVPQDLRSAGVDEIVDMVLDGMELMDQEDEFPISEERNELHDIAITG
jgi:flagellar biosynthesis protein FlhF